MPVQDPDDIYSDPQTIGSDDDDDLLAEDDLPEEQKRELSQTPFLPESQNDDRGDIAELREPPEGVSDVAQETDEDDYLANNDQEGDAADRAA